MTDCTYTTDRLESEFLEIVLYLSLHGAFNCTWGQQTHSKSIETIPSGRNGQPTLTYINGLGCQASPMAYSPAWHQAYQNGHS